MTFLQRSIRMVVAVLVLGTALAATPSAASASTCGINKGGHQGYYICEYGVTHVTWPDGHRQIFLVGTDYAVWDIWEVGPYSDVWSGWRSLGGQGRSGVDYYRLSDTHIDLNVQGTDGQTYCKYWDASEDWWPGEKGWALGSDCG